MLVFVSVVVPLPTFVKPLLFAPMNWPPHDVFRLSPPKVRLFDPSVMLPPSVPPPAMEPIVSFWFVSWSMTPAAFASTTADVSAMAKPLVSRSVPPWTNVVPV